MNLALRNRARSEPRAAVKLEPRQALGRSAQFGTQELLQLFRRPR